MTCSEYHENYCTFGCCVHICFSTALAEAKGYAERRKIEMHYVSKDTLERMSSKRPHQVLTE